MTVYVLTEGYFYEGNWVLGVHSTAAGAVRAMRKEVGRLKDWEDPGKYRVVHGGLRWDNDDRVFQVIPVELDKGDA